ncbi:flagellar basal-body MS-ring/collar protein FliF [Roseovarius phycicola]|uniref:Flagellar M-ring protein n=1 Tax=Roseovarius phycicola TaxID=3080976 RepID=A0ABZ2HHY4_9RHOB
MQQFLDVWTALDARRRVVVSLATIGMFAAILALTKVVSNPSLTLLYAGLDSGAAGEVIQSLEQRGITYDVKGGAIYVDAARRDELRMTLASEGLPANSTSGYELLDSLSGFGTTSQMFDAAYWRAKEGELARTILTHPSVSSARVHIANKGSNPFQRDVKPTASLSIRTTGAGLSGQHARALKFLIASAVPGLVPEDVSVIDGDGGLIGRADDSRSNSTDEKAELLRARVQRLLEARVGLGNAVVEVSVENVTKSESLRETVIDPGSRVAISTDTEELSNSSADQGTSDVTVASNLPNGDAGNADSSSSETSETRERINYEVSQTERQVTLSPGAIKRLTVAVLLNGISTTDAQGIEQFEDRTEEELGALQELVASAVGFDEARGDVITVKTMQFEVIPEQGTNAQFSLLSHFAMDWVALIKSAILGLVSLVLGLFVVKPLLSHPATNAAPLLEAASQNLAEPSLSNAPSLVGEIDNGDVPADSMTLVSSVGDSGGFLGAGNLPSLQGQSEDPVDRLRLMIGERQDETVEILRNWLEGEEERA